MEEFSIETLGDLRLQGLSDGEIARRLGQDSAQFVLSLYRHGDDTKPVRERELVKSVTSFKNFDSLSNLSDIMVWVRRLALDCSERCARELELNNRLPSTLTLSFRQDGQLRSKVCATPDFTDAESISRSVMAELKRLGRHVLPCRYLGLLCSSFVESQATKIDSFFSSSTSNNSNAPAASASSTTNLFEQFELEQLAAQALAPPQPQPPESAATTGINKKKRPAAAAAASADLTFLICDRCGKRIEQEDLTEHQDFHVAQDVQNEWREEAPGPGKQKKAKAAAKKQKQKGILNFFSS